MNNKLVSIAKRAGSIVLCRKKIKQNSLYDYEILMVERKSQLDFGSVMAFPGGKFDQTIDLQLKNRYNFEQKVQATAIRQVFQQTGVFLTHQPVLQSEKLKKIQNIKNQFLVQTMQGKVYSFQPFFQKLCHQIQPMTNLKKFIRLITIPLLKSRFDTSFYTALLQSYNFINFGKYAQKQKYLHTTDQIIISQQFKSFRWMSPLQVIKEFNSKQILLAPPQYIMLNIMSGFFYYSQFAEFLKNINEQGLNMASNIASIVFNRGYLKQQYPYAITFVGDEQFPFLKNAQQQKCQHLRQQILDDYNRINVKGKNRILVKKPKQFFESQFDVQCTVPGSFINKLNNSRKIIQMTQLYN